MHIRYFLNVQIDLAVGRYLDSVFSVIRRMYNITLCLLGVSLVCIFKYKFKLLSVSNKDYYEVQVQCVSKGV